MTQNDIEELSSQTLKDGRRLFNVSEFIFVISIIGIILLVLIGIIAAVNAGQLHIGFALGIGCIVLISCVVLYILAVLTTHFAKVLVHISFLNLAILEKINKHPNEKKQSLIFSGERQDVMTKAEKLKPYKEEPASHQQRVEPSV